MIDSAIIADINKNYLEAINLYEQNISNLSHNIETYTNLAFIYWAFAAEEIEFNSVNDIPREFSIIGGDRYLEIINKGLIHFPESLELNFWKKYFTYRLFLEEFSQEDCVKLIEKYNVDSLIPYFFLFLFDNNRYKQQMEELDDIVTSLPTAKNLYVKSFLAYGGN